MGMQNHLVRYRRKTNEQLEAELTRLEAINSGFASQNMGTKAFTVALSQVADQLEAASYVLAERGYSVPTGPRATPNHHVGTVDFSQLS